MARQPRFRIAGVAQLITQRGNNRQDVFFSEQDYLYYLDVLNETAIKYECQIHAFALMSNHIYILATPTTLDGISQLMKGVGQRYVSYINKLEKRTGTLWDGRYKASLVEDGHYLIACMRYIEMTPVRLKTTTTPKDYQWSSYRTNAQGKDAKVKITPHESYSAIVQWSDKTEKDVQEEYKQRLRDPINDEELQIICKATDSCIVYGSKLFQESIRNMGSDPKR
jgi:putative transposase